jgi:hypothetical protein
LFLVIDEIEVYSDVVVIGHAGIFPGLPSYRDRVNNLATG